MADQTIILISETWGESARRDAFSVLCAFALIAPGWWLGSAAMQWVGFLMLAIVVAARATGIRKAHSMTIAEARAKLDEIEADHD